MAQLTPDGPCQIPKQ